jgi:hypothetical protein
MRTSSSPTLALISMNPPVRPETECSPPVFPLDPARRADRALATAEAKLQVGALDAALGLLATAEAAPLDEQQRARADLMRGQIAFVSGRGMDAPA